jgi:taurine transport system permease protein
LKTKDKNSVLFILGRIWHYLQYTVGLIGFLVVWQVLAVNTGLVPTPFETLQRLGTVWATPVAKVSMISHVLISMQRVFLALLVAIVVGIPLGVMLGWNRKFRAVIWPIFETIRPVPPIALIPLITLWMGTGEFSRVFIIFFGVLMPITVNSTVGVEMVPPLNIDVGRIFGASRKDLLFDIIWPSSIPAIFAGIRVSLSAGWCVLLAAEMLSARSGLGFLIMQGSYNNDIELSIVGMFMIGILGALFAVLFDILERWLCPWLKK